MEIEKKKFCADLILTDAIMDMAEEDGITQLEAKSLILMLIQPYMILKLDYGETDQITSEISTRKQHE